MESNSKRKLAARIGGLSLHLKRDSYAIAAHARAGLEEKFRLQALAAKPGLTGDALDREIALIKRLYYSRLALRRQKSRISRR